MINETHGTNAILTNPPNRRERRILRSASVWNFRIKEQPQSRYETKQSPVLSVCFAFLDCVSRNCLEIQKTFSSVLSYSAVFAESILIHE
jgi:hypothetical protein